LGGTFEFEPTEHGSTIIDGTYDSGTTEAKIMMNYTLQRCTVADESTFEQCIPTDPLDSSDLPITGAFHCASSAHLKKCADDDQWEDILGSTIQTEYTFYYTDGSFGKLSLDDTTHYVFRVRAKLGEINIPQCDQELLPACEICNNWSPLFRVSTSAPTPPGQPDWVASEGRDMQGGHLRLRWKAPINRGGADITGYRVYLRRYKNITGTNILPQGLVTEEFAKYIKFMQDDGTFTTASGNTDVDLDNDCDDDRCSEIPGTTPQQCRCLVYDSTIEPNPPAQPPTDFKLSCYRRATEAKDTLKANTNGDGNSDLEEGSCAVDTVTAGIVVRKNLQTTSQGRWAFPCIKALRQLQEYTFEVQAQNDVSFGIFSSTKMLKTIGTTKPGRPRVPTVVSTTGGSILLKFLAPEDQGGSRYTS
jgi:hypothetical protein